MAHTGAMLPDLIQGGFKLAGFFLAPSTMFTSSSKDSDGTGAIVLLLLFVFVVLFVGVLGNRIEKQNKVENDKSQVLLETFFIEKTSIPPDTVERQNKILTGKMMCLSNQMQQLQTSNNGKQATVRVREYEFWMLYYLLNQLGLAILNVLALQMKIPAARVLGKSMDQNDVIVKMLRHMDISWPLVQKLFALHRDTFETQVWTVDQIKSQLFYIQEKMHVPQTNPQWAPQLEQYRDICWILLYHLSK